MKLNCELALTLAPAGLYPSLYLIATDVAFVTFSNTVALIPELLSINSIVLSTILTAASPDSRFASISPLASLRDCAAKVTLGSVGAPKVLSLCPDTAVFIIARLAFIVEPCDADAFDPDVI